MNEAKYLILIKGEDKTKIIKTAKYISGFYHVEFYSGGKYTYGYHNITKYMNPRVYEGKNLEVVINGEFVYGVSKVLVFDTLTKVIESNGNSRLYKSIQVSCSDVQSKHNSRNVFSYLKELSQKLKIQVDEDTSFLGNQYEKLTKVNENSVLKDYLYERTKKKSIQHNQIIMPFGFNISQAEATRNSMKTKLSIIEGPPGTGKTQTILNIIANAIINNETVAVVSNNNSSTINIQEKLESYNLGFLSAFLGSRENKEKFILNQSIIPHEISTWMIENNELSALGKNLISNLNSLLDLNRSVNLKAKLQSEVNAVEVEYKHFLKSIELEADTVPNMYSKLNSNSINKMITSIRSYKSISWFNSLRFYLKHKISFAKVFKSNRNTTIDLLSNIYYIKLIEEYRTTIQVIEDLLNNSDFENFSKEFEIDSMRYFKACLHRQYGEKNREKFSSRDLYYRMKSVQENYPVILSTTHSLRNISKTEVLYDYLIIDEASQVDIVSGALALSVAKNAVIVGDEKQLPHVISKSFAESTESVLLNYDINSAFSYNNSLLQSMKLIYSNKVPTVLLKEHYRCDPNIIEYCNKKFYNSELIIHTRNKEEHPLSVFVSNKGNHQRGHFNQRQIDIIVEDVLPKLSPNETVGIITPYREQANQLIKRFHNHGIDADTVHKYQGRERDVIIISTVANTIEKGSFVDNDNLINVAVSRAKKKLYLVTSNDMLVDNNTNISDLVSYIKYNNYDVEESKVSSVFDALYKNCSNEILELFTNIKKVSEYKSENIMYQLISKIVSSEEFNHLNVLLHYPLRHIIKDYSLLSVEELKYATNHLTHVDFLLYNDLTKKIKLIIEVDGFAFHNKNTKQKVRDLKKDSILEKYSIPLLRLNTTGSNEESQIIKALR